MKTIAKIDAITFMFFVWADDLDMRPIKTMS